MTTALSNRLGDLAEPTRLRLLLALEEQDLSVAEMQEGLQLPQSTVSRHLRILSDGGWVDYEPQGASNRYRFRRERQPGPAGQLWDLVRESAVADPASREDRRRIRAVLADRRSRSRAFFAGAAGDWDRIREEHFGRRYELFPALGLLDPEWIVADLGCGSGQFSAAIAPFVRRVIAVDESPEMLEAARARLEPFPNVECRAGELEFLPLAEAEAHLAVMALVLPYVEEPARVLAEASRGLEPGGRLLLLDLVSHDRREYQDTMQHLRLGVARGELFEWLAAAGLVEPRMTALPLDPLARGPGLFVAAARKPALPGADAPLA